MNDLQKEVEQFRQKFQPDPLTNMEGFDTFAKQYYALLLKFVEECKEKIRLNQATPSGQAIYGVMARTVVDIDDAFAWLKKGE